MYAVPVHGTRGVVGRGPFQCPYGMLTMGSHIVLAETKVASEPKELARLLEVLSVGTRVRIVQLLKSQSLRVNALGARLAVHYLLLGKEHRYEDAQR